ncbi:hypothetical protein OG453_31165 [Streptomyces sp. NBC_01381]|uniref:DUF4232 domain-containing protein n=1 Tax=Streptomyces sp. NBC_01381 TaxID=2903845 RepID=UPI0022541817|nr:DUF4232 domain-containing protein [Streptomyces sp. NBC_01381]MCX4671105.1 hypothetical protein [Streptomyces sp. NBC_01381]
MRTSRIRTAALAAATAALALGGLTACGGGDNATDNAKSSASEDVGKNTGTDGRATEKGSTEKTGNASENTGNKPAAGGVQNGSDAASVSQCGDQDIDFSVLHRFRGEQGEHLLITGRNDTSKPCWVTSHPSVKLGDTDEVLPLSKDSEGGDSRITIQPDGKVYSAAALFSDGSPKRAAQGLALALRDEAGHTNPGVSLNVYDETGAASNFKWTSADILNWNTSKPYDF